MTVITHDGLTRPVYAGGSGPALVPPGSLGAIPPSIAGQFAAAKAANAVNVKISPPRSTAVVVGAPRLAITYTGTAPTSNARVDGRQHSLNLPLEMVAATMKRSSRFTLQLVAQSTIYNTHPAGGSVQFTKVHVTLPTAKVAR